ncbi:hypothetical protein FWK35_00001196 [Aphis craccivora]|uniref:Uncharacterized protein n=1 Tax=Aphis craccivora TaxID=307492 RepID=A0A6G0ZEC2_APHCR|nr:hypothetical protein FWK35_00001196 [Aphis craccivora]
MVGKKGGLCLNRLLEGKLSVVFLILSYEHKKFYDFSTSKLLANFCVFDRFRKNVNYKRL